MLPYFFRYYDPIVDHYFIHDNQSDDGSLDILHRHPRVTVLPLHLEGESLMEAAFAQVNQFWHPSRGKADWVAVCNVDEFFWHPHLTWYLEACRAKGITWLGSKGFQMVSDTFPGPEDDLPQTVRFGARHGNLDKPSFFNPDAIANSGFGIGRHTARPEGRVVRARRTRIRLLHYKFLGTDYVVERHAELDARRRQKDRSKGWGVHYDPKATLEQLEEYKAQSREVVPPSESRLARLWWRLSSWPRPVPERAPAIQRNS